MTRLPNGRFTRGSTPATRQPGAPLVDLARKSPPHVKGWQTRKARLRDAVMRGKAALDRELGR